MTIEVIAGVAAWLGFVLGVARVISIGQSPIGILGSERQSPGIAVHPNAMLGP